MNSPVALILLLSIAMYIGSTDARKDPGEYWRTVMKDEPMPDAIKRLMPQHSSVPLSNEKTDCHTSSSVGGIEDGDKTFEPKPNISIYHDDTKLKGDKPSFEPRPNLSVYRDDTKLEEDKPSFEPRPNLSVYRDDTKLEEDKPSFEPRPNLSVYHDDTKLEEDKPSFEPRPNLSVYHD